MLVFWKENLVLLSVPKTGSTALQAALAPRASMVLRHPPYLKHAPCYRYKRFLKPFFVQAGGQNPEVMAVVRNPISWLSSWYRYRTRDDLIGQENSTRDVTFDEFVLEYCKGQPADFANVGSQNKFLRINDNEVGAQHLFQYEQWDILIAFLEERLGRTIATKQKNVSPQFDLTLSPAVEERLRDKRRAEFEIWDLAKR
ncbi:MAG: gamma-glutamyl kinase [Yoonia sp.]|uniref:gamma-glutamyl kinase n=1 Tax=Yoonia sp. TaxID=2212373 RepID=UPI003EF2E990